MKNLFLIDGASGTGKSDLVHYVTEYQINSALVKKYSNRAEREYEKASKEWKLDLYHIDEDEFDKRNFDYQYVYAGKKYGFNRGELLGCLSKSENVFVIVRNTELINKLVAEYHYINVVPIFIHSDEARIRSRLESQKMSEATINFRLNRNAIAFGDYLKSPEIYNEVLINNSSKTDFRRMLDVVIEKYREQPDVNENLIFLLMSFNPGNPSLQDYAAAMKRAVNNFNPSYSCINLDDVAGSYEISKEAKKKIKDCRLAIV